MHVSEMVFAFVIILVESDKLFFVRQLENNSEEAQELQHDLFVACLKGSQLY